MKEEQERTPLRTILQNFLNHIENLEIQRIEDSYEKEFQELKFFSELLKTSKQYSCSEGEKEVNRKKNRYKDILPFDNSRVILSEYAGVPGSDYINANYIRGASGSPAYIACQGPLPHTVNDFWRMVVECEVQVIVMACNEEEAGKHKCENYWVEHEGEEKQFGMVSIQLIKASTVCPDFLVRTMRLKYTNSNSEPEERTVCQFHYSAWPDHGVPPLVRPLLDMVRLVRDTQASETLPVLVHCSAGCGRTGTICAIDYVWGLLRAGKLNRDFSLYKLVRDMRKQRIAMVQTKEQYVLVHQAVRELFQEQLRMIDSHPYENIDANGMPLVKHLEPLYTTPGPATPELSCEEKQDGKEKEIITPVPPLPQKKRSHTAASKQEKEVENLTEKQRSIVEQAGNSLLQKPRIAKLKALFERSPALKDRSSQAKHRSSQLVSRSHSLGAVRNGDAVQALPIPCHGILRVPHLSSSSKPTLPVKRSKSLKVLGSSQSYKLSLTSQDKSSSTSSTISSTELDTDMLTSAESERYHQASGEDITQVAKSVMPPKIVPKVRDMDTGLKQLKSKCVLSSNPNVNNIISHQPEHFINCEHSHATSVIPKRRRSLESINLEETTANVMTAYNRNDVRVPHRKPHVLDEDARRLLQDCKDYLKSTLKTDKLQLIQGRERTNKAQHHEQFQNLALEAQRKVNAIVAGLGVRERRNSFRQAVGTSQEGESKSSTRSRDHDKMWPVGNLISKFSPFQHSPFQTASGTVPSFEQSKGNSRNRVQQISVQPKLARTSKSHTVHTKANENCNSTSMLTNNIVPESSTPGASLVQSWEINKKTDSAYVRMGKVGAYPKQLSREPLRTDVQNSEVHSHIRQLDETARRVKASYPNANVANHLAPHYVPTLGAGCSEVINSNSGNSCGESRICAPQESGSVTKEPRLRTTTGVTANDKGRSNSSLPLHVMSSPPSPTATGSVPLSDPQAAFKQQVQQKLQGGQEVSYGLVAGVQLRRGSRDDLALCPSPNNSSNSGPNAPRVRRHASVVLLRRSIVEGSSHPQPSLTVWKSPSSESNEYGPHSSMATKPEVKDSDKWWSEAPGIDVDTVGASMGDSSCNITRALENLHLRKPSIPTGGGGGGAAAAAVVSPSMQGFASRQSPFTQHSTGASVKKQHYF